MSVADTAIVPLQDVLGVGTAARMNLPGRPGGNWRWRFAKGALTPQIRRRLRLITEGSGRTLPPSSRSKSRRTTSSSAGGVDASEHVTFSLSWSAAQRRVLVRGEL